MPVGKLAPVKDQTLGFFSFHFNEPFTFSEYRVRNLLYKSDSEEVQAAIAGIGFVNYSLGFLLAADKEFREAEKVLLDAIGEKEPSELEPDTTGLLEISPYKDHVSINWTGWKSFELERRLSSVLAEYFGLTERISLVTGLLIEEFPGIWGFTECPKGEGAHTTIKKRLATQYGKDVDALVRQESWRHDQVHRQTWFAGAVGPPWSIVFKDQFIFDGWVEEKGKLFTADQVKQGNRALRAFAEWWLTTAMIQTDCLPESMAEKVKDLPEYQLPVIPRVVR